MDNTEDGTHHKVTFSVQDQGAENMCFDFVELLAELRNRVYFFMDGKADTPQTLVRNAEPRSKNKGLVKQQAFDSRGYNGFMQTCKQLRKEYRPQWLRETTVCLYANEVTAYAKTFFSSPEDYQNAPELLLLSWPSDSYSQSSPKSHDIGPPLKFSADCPNTSVKFVNLYVADSSGGLCQACPSPAQLGCQCALLAMDFDVRQHFQPMFELNNFLANDNALWQKAVRELVPYIMTVGVSTRWMDHEDTVITIHLKHDKKPEHLPEASPTATNLWARGGNFLLFARRSYGFCGV